MIGMFILLLGGLKLSAPPLRYRVGSSARPRTIPQPAPVVLLDLGIASDVVARANRGPVVQMIALEVQDDRHRIDSGDPSEFLPEEGHAHADSVL